MLDSRATKRRLRSGVAVGAAAVACHEIEGREHGGDGGHGQQPCGIVAWAGDVEEHGARQQHGGRDGQAVQGLEEGAAAVVVADRAAHVEEQGVLLVGHIGRLHLRSLWPFCPPLCGFGGAGTVLVTVESGCLRCFSSLNGCGLPGCGAGGVGFL
jgi:hypothetical protein